MTPEQTGRVVEANVGRQLMHIRKNRGMTLMQMQVATGITYQQICDICNGKASPTARTLWKLATGLGVSVEYFFHGLESVADPGYVYRARVDQLAG